MKNPYDYLGKEIGLEKPGGNTFLSWGIRTGENQIWTHGIIDRNNYLKLGASRDGSIDIAQIVSVKKIEVRVWLTKKQALQIKTQKGSAVIGLPYLDKYYGEWADSIYARLEQAVKENIARFAREKEEKTQRELNLQKEKEEKEKRRNDMLAAMSPAERAAFLNQEREEKLETERIREKKRQEAEARRAEKAEKDKDQQIRELTEQLRIANERAAISGKGSSGTKDIVKGAAAGWIIGGPAGGIIGAIVGKDKADRKK